MACRPVSEFDGKRLLAKFMTERSIKVEDKALRVKSDDVRDTVQLMARIAQCKRRTNKQTKANGGAFPIIKRRRAMGHHRKARV